MGGGIPTIDISVCYRRWLRGVEGGGARDILLYHQSLKAKTETKREPCIGFTFKTCSSVHDTNLLRQNERQVYIYKKKRRYISYLEIGEKEYHLYISCIWQKASKSDSDGKAGNFPHFYYHFLRVRAEEETEKFCTFSWKSKFPLFNYISKKFKCLICNIRSFHIEKIIKDSTFSLEKTAFEI